MYHCHFPGNACLEVVRHQPEGNPGGGEDVEETAIGSPPENHCSGPPGSTIDAAQLPPFWLIGRAGPLSRRAKRRFARSCLVQVSKVIAAKSLRVFNWCPRLSTSPGYKVFRRITCFSYSSLMVLFSLWFR